MRFFLLIRSRDIEEKRSALTMKKEQNASLIFSDIKPWEVSGR